jgi:hypothetical protein
MMEAASTSETSVKFYQTTRRNIPEDSHLRMLTRFMCLFMCMYVLMCIGPVCVRAKKKYMHACMHRVVAKSGHTWNENSYEYVFFLMIIYRIWLLFMCTLADVFTSTCINTLFTLNIQNGRLRRMASVFRLWHHSEEMELMRACSFCCFREHCNIWHRNQFNAEVFKIM